MTEQGNLPEGIGQPDGVKTVATVLFGQSIEALRTTPGPDHAPSRTHKHANGGFADPQGCE